MNMQKTVENLSLFLLIVVVVVRPLVAETYDSAGSPLTAALGAVSDPTPVRTLVFDLAILIGACGWLASRFFGTPRRYRWTGLEWGGGLIIVAAVISCVFAGNKRLAINASADWLCLIVLTIGLVQLMHRRWQRRLVLAAVMASACAQAVHCADEYFWGFPDTWAHYESMKAEFWAQQGVELDSAKVEMFERRMRAHEASGYFPHSNIAGAYLIMCGLVGVGITAVQWRWAADPVGVALAVFCTLAVAVVLLAAFLTGSLGALVAGGFGVVVWLFVRWKALWIDRHRRGALVIGWVCAVVGMLAFVGHGLVHDRFPHMSLTFRWQYWKASAGLMADHVWTGVGRENFGRKYLQYKPIDSPEEISNPHNLFVQAMSEWGVLGLGGIVVILVGVSRVVARPVLRRGFRDDDAEPEPGLVAWWLWGGALLVTLTVVRLALIDTDADKFFAFAYSTSVVTGMAWLAGFAAFSFNDQAGIGSSPLKKGGKKRDRVTGSDPIGFLERPIVPTALAVALLVFLLQDMINFASFVPGSATTCFTLLAVCVAQRVGVEPVPAGRGNRGRIAAIVAGLLATVGFVVLTAWPVVSANRSLVRAEKMAPQIAPAPISSQLADRFYREALAADPLDPTPAVARAGWLYSITSIPQLREPAFALAVESVEEARKRDPFDVKLPRMLMQLHRAEAEYMHAPEDYLSAVRAAEEALKLYPLDPPGIKSLADCLTEAGTASGSQDLLRQALETYQKAMDVDDSRLEWETIRRFRARELDEIREQMNGIRQRLSATE